jgi:hypothetical protein
MRLAFLPPVYSYHNLVSNSPWVDSLFAISFGTPLTILARVMRRLLFVYSTDNKSTPRYTHVYVPILDFFPGKNISLLVQRGGSMFFFEAEAL